MLAPSRQSDKLASQRTSGTLGSGHVIVAIVSATPGSVSTLTEKPIDEERSIVYDGSLRHLVKYTKSAGMMSKSHVNKPAAM